MSDPFVNNTRENGRDGSSWEMRFLVAIEQNEREKPDLQQRNGKNGVVLSRNERRLNLLRFFPGCAANAEQEFISSFLIHP